MNLHRTCQTNFPAQTALCNLLFSPIRACSAMMTFAHNGLVPGSSPGGPTIQPIDIAVTSECAAVRSEVCRT